MENLSSRPLQQVDRKVSESRYRPVSRRVFALAFVAAISPTAAVANNCEAYVGTVPEIVDITDVIAAVRDIEPRSEFETAEEFENRISTDRTSYTGEFVLQREIELGLDNENVRYDVEREVFQIQNDALEGSVIASLNVSSLFDYGGAFGNSVRQTYLALGFSTDREIVGTRLATNAFGAETEVTELNIRSIGVLELGLRGILRPAIILNAEIPFDTVVAELTVPRAQAEQFRENLRAAFSMVLAEPYYVQGTDTTAATRSSPTDVTSEFEALIVDLQCAFIMDNENRVLLALETR